jgi:hypothetical protein
MITPGPRDAGLCISPWQHWRASNADQGSPFYRNFSAASFVAKALFSFTV